MKKVVRILLCYSCLTMTACSGSGTIDASAGDSNVDAAQSDIQTTDALKDSSTQDARPDATPADSRSCEVNPAEWVIRKPRNMQCKVVAHQVDPEQKYVTVLQADHVCTYDYRGVKGLIYVQTTPLECSGVGYLEGESPVVKSNMDLALIKIGDCVDRLSNVLYEYGGQHFLDRLTFEYDGVRFVYDHWCPMYHISSISCAMIKDKDGNMIDNGCTPQRTRPIVCNRVDKDGKYDESMKDNIQDNFKCPGL